MHLVLPKSCSEEQQAYIQQYPQSSNVTVTCKQAQVLPSLLFGIANLLPLLLVIPVFDRFVYTCLNGWKWFSMLARMAAGNFFIIASLFSAAVIEYVRIKQLVKGITIEGNVTINTIAYHEDVSLYNLASPMTQLYIIVPYLFFMFAELLCNITGIRLEQHCAVTNLLFCMSCVQFSMAKCFNYITHFLSLQLQLLNSYTPSLLAT